MSRRHEVSSAPENMVWGYIDSATPPVLEIASGDTVTLHSFPAGGKESLPEDQEFSRRIISWRSTRWCRDQGRISSPGRSM